MKTFYDLRGGETKNDKPQVETVEGRVIWKTKTHWLIYINPDDHYNPILSKIYKDDMYWTTLIGYIVIPKGVRITSCYFATGLVDGLKNLFKTGKTSTITKSKGEFPEELL